jgi:multidrug efflux system membrane fusion protein
MARPDARAISRLATLVIGVTLAASMLPIAGCGGEAKGKGGKIPAVPVLTGKVVRKSMPVEIRAIGHVEAIATVAVRARVGGELMKVGFQEGDVVAKGKTILSIDPRTYEATLREAEARLAKDRALLEKAKKDVERYAGLVKQDFITKEQFDQIVAQAASLEATLSADQASVDNARLQVAYCSITAPISGRTGNLQVKPGTLVKANDQVIVTINQTKPIDASFSVPAQFLSSIRKRRVADVRVTATVPDDGIASYEGRLFFVDNAVDPSTSTILLKARFENEKEGLWPGQFVNLVIRLGEEKDRVVAPTPAVQTGQQGSYVYVVKDDQTAELRPVKVARMDELESVIESGLSGGETVVTDGQLRLLPGAKIEARSDSGGGGAAPSSAGRAPGSGSGTAAPAEK